MNTTLGLLKHIPCPKGDACTTYRCMFRHAGDEEKWPLGTVGAQESQAPIQTPIQAQRHTVSQRTSSDKAASGQRLTAPPTNAAAKAMPVVAESGHQDAPRKRIKLGNDDYDPASPSLPPSSNSEYGVGRGDKANEPIPSKTKLSLHSASANVATSSVRQEPISPPHLKRKTVESATKARLPLSPLSRPKPVSASAVPQKAQGPVTARPKASTSKATQQRQQQQQQQQPSPSSSKAATASPQVKPSSRKPETLNPRHLGAAPAKYEIRYRLLKMLHAEFSRLNNELRAKGSAEEKKQLLMSDQELIWTALDLEENLAIAKPSIYSNVIKNRVMAYKRMTLVQWTKERTEALEKEAQKQQQQQQQQSGAKLPSTHPTLPQSKTGSRDPSSKNPEAELDTGLTPEQELAFLRAHLLTPIDKLANNGYVPVVPPEADVQKAREADEVSKGWEICDRCSTRFQVFPGRREADGALTSGGSCTHHPGKTYYPPRPVGGGFGGGFGDNPKRYRCCGQAVGDSPGCVTTSSHVFKASDPKRLASLWNFAETPSNPNAPVDRAVCFDCEMGYTVHGMELIRVTATSWPGGEELLDILVRPIGEIIDLNSRYSGVWPEDMANALPFSASTIFSKSSSRSTTERDSGSGSSTTEKDSNNNSSSNTERRRLQMVSSPLVARDLLFALIRPETPLIGHGLENDLNSMRIVHPTISDTVLLFPHPKGLPVRYGLKMLVDRHLHRQIQVEPDNGVVTGHDSGEDARAAGDLVRFKIKQQWATKRNDGWTFVDGVLTAPAGAMHGGPGGRLTEAFIENKI